MTGRVTLQALITTGDALCEGGDLTALIHVVAEIEHAATGLRRQDLEAARAAVARWSARAADRRLALGSALAGRRAGRGAVRSYGAVAAA